MQLAYSWALPHQSRRALVRAILSSCFLEAYIDRYVATPIMSETVKERIDTTLKKHGSGWATIEDCTRTVLRIAADESVQGTTFRRSGLLWMSNSLKQVALWR